ncbi:hypothetical protein HYV57_01500 [Candidatus Peregrinibacteria bacterium]|nr:hypothetical protein [Candidatus Peregrinibacteria bacterium]
MMIKKSIKNHQLPLHLEYLFKEAGKKIFKIEHLHGIIEQHKFRITNPLSGKSMLIIGSNMYPDLSCAASIFTKHKWLTYKILKKANILTPRTRLFKNPENAVYIWKKRFHEKGIVMKPENGGLGEKVFTGIKNIEDVKKYAKMILKNYKNGIIQRHKKGKDLRIQAIGGQYFAACRRLPAHVYGNGKNSIKELILEKNKEKAKLHTKNQIIVDAETKKLLRKKNYTLNSIPHEGEKVRLKKASNIGLGGEPVDVTDILHSSFRTLIPTISELFSVKTFAIDCIVKDLRAPFNKENASIIEINAPCMWALNHFARGQKRNAALAILDSFFEQESFDASSKKYLI